MQNCPAIQLHTHTCIHVADFNVPQISVPENETSMELVCIEKPFPTAQSVTLRVEVLNVEGDEICMNEKLIKTLMLLFVVL